MKSTRKMKILSILMSAAMVFGTMPASIAMGAENDDIVQDSEDAANVSVDDTDFTLSAYEEPTEDITGDPVVEEAVPESGEGEYIEETYTEDEGTESVEAVPEDTPAEEETDENEYGIQMLASTSVTYVDADGSEQGPVSATEVTSGDTTWSNGWYVVDSNFTNSNRITVSGEVNLILADGYTLTASAGITVQGDNSLTIYGQTAGSGTLAAQASGNYNAAIGGTDNNGCGVVTINGGIVTASGGTHAAGIGGGYGKAGGTITISGGTVTATSTGNYGAGIGGGGNGTGGDITINGGTVTASAGKYAAGIGGGNSGSGGTITISGGTVTASAGDNGAGIGGGNSGSGGTITISGGTVTASAGNYGAGIGGGYNGGSGTFTTGDSGNAFIVASKISDSSQKDSWSGAIIIGSSGQVYSTPELTTDATVPAGDSLLIPEGTGLTIGSGTTLTNSGKVYQNWGSTFNKNSSYKDNGETYYQIVNNLNYSWPLVEDGTKSYSGNTYALEKTTVSTSIENEITLTNYTITKQDESTETSNGRSFAMPDEPVQLNDGIAMIPIPEADTEEFTYNGTEQTYTLAESDYYTITGNVQSDAGIYMVTVRLKDTTTSMWENETTDPITYIFVINKADQSISYADTTMQKLDYDDPFTNELTKDQVFGDITYSFTPVIGDDEVIRLDETSGEVTIIGPGIVTVTAAAPGSDNYNEATASYILIVNSDEVKAKIDVNHDSVLYDDDRGEYVDALTYDGQDLELEMLVDLDNDEQSHKTQEVTYQWYSVDIDRTEVTPINGATDYTYTLTGDAGDYIYLCVATVPYDNGYTHTVYSLIEITINQADNNLTITTESLDKIYDGSAVQEPEITADFGEESVTYTWYQVNGDVSEELDEAPSEIGNYKVVASIEETDNYKGASAELAFTISAKEIAEDMFTVDTTDETYNGYEITKEITSDLVKGTDYTVSYEDNKDAGTATITITGIGIYSGELTYMFEIQPQEITETQFSVDTNEETYSGSAFTKDITSDLKEDTDYSVSYVDNTNAGTATITITGIGNYTGELTYTFIINKAVYDMSGVIFPDMTYTYNGKEHEIKVEIQDGGSLPDGVTVSYENNTGTEVGTYDATAHFTGDEENYEPITDMTATLTIIDASFGDMTITAVGYTGIYDGQAHSITVTLSGDAEGATVTYSTEKDGNYTEENPSFTEVGTYTVYYKVSKTNYVVVTGSETVEITETDIKTGTTITVTADLVYNGSKQNAGVVVTAKDGIVLEEGVDYVLEGQKAKAAGTHKAIVTGIGKYYGTCTVNYKIAKADQKLTAKVKKTGTKKYTIKASKLKNDSKTFKIKVNKKGKMKVRYSTNNSKIKVDKNGKVTLKKGLKAGTYKIKVTTGASKNYKASKNPKYITVKVK